MSLGKTQNALGQGEGLCEEGMRATRLCRRGSRSPAPALNLGRQGGEVLDKPCC